MTPAHRLSDRVIPQRLPSCPGKDSRYTIKHNQEEPEKPWWVFYEPPGAPKPIPADDPHPELVRVVNLLKDRHRGGEGGGPFSINEHGQVVARCRAPQGRGNVVNVVAIDAGEIWEYHDPITFSDGALDPCTKPKAGEPWTGPLTGTTYSFVAPNNPKPPSRCLDEVFIEIEGTNVQLSAAARISNYPPRSGPLHEFLVALRKYLPNGGAFRVNEHARAFTSATNTFIGIVPLTAWFRPLTSRA